MMVNERIQNRIDELVVVFDGLRMRPWQAPAWCSIGYEVITNNHYHAPNSNTNLGVMMTRCSDMGELEWMNGNKYVAMNATVMPL